MRSSTLLAGFLFLVAHQVSAQDVVVQRWLIRGPTPSGDDTARVVRDHLGGEAQVMPTLSDEGWFEVDADAFGRVDLNNVFEGQSTAWSAAYAHVYVFTPEDRTVLLVADSDDDLVVRLNGQRVWLNVVARGLGRGSDTVTVRLAQGWNSLLLKPLNRTGGFGLLARLAPAESDGLDDVLLSIARPPGLVAHNHPEPAVTVGPVLLGPSLTWIGDELVSESQIPLAAWGAETFSEVTVRLSHGSERIAQNDFVDLSPGRPVSFVIDLPFADARSAGIGEKPFAADVAWRGGSRRARVFIDPDRLMRAFGGRIDVGSLTIDSAGGEPQRMTAALAVPPALDGLSVDLLALGIGPRAQYRVNGIEVGWEGGRAQLCAPCQAGDSLQIDIAPEPGRPIWMEPVVRVREIGYAEYADGYTYAQALAGRAPPIERPDPVAWLRALGEPHGAGYRALASRYRAAYEPLATEIRRDTLHLVGNSHIDAAWLWPWSETIEVIRDTWRTSLKLAQLFPGYVFTGSSAAYYDAMDRLEPSLADSLVVAIERGQWMPVGGWWVESDLNVPSGESLVRQGLYGQRYFERRFGFRSRVAWTPDCFGYPWTIPQVLKGAGLDYFVTQKIRWNDSTEFPYNAFYWKGRDGTQVLTYNPYGYTHDLDPNKLISERVEDRERTGSNHQIVLYGVGDHGGGPTITMLRQAEDLRRVPTFPVLLYDEPLNALEAVEAGEDTAELPVWDDELYLEYHRGTYTTQATTKARNRRSEVMLQIAEALATVSTGPYPRRRLEDAWRLVLFNQFHDILPGSGIHEIYEDAELFYDSAWAMIDSVTSSGFADLRTRMDTRVGHWPVVVFNSLGWPRSGTFTLSDADGGSIRVFVRDVPAYGARVIRVPRDTMPKDLRRLEEPRAGRSWIENVYLRVEIDSLTGSVVRLYDKVNRRDALAPGDRGNVLQIFDDRPDQWDAWNIVLTAKMWEVTDVVAVMSAADSWQARLSVERRWGNSTFRQTYVLGRGSRYLDIHNDIDWHERRKALKTAFALNVDADSATYEVPYGTVGRTGRPRTKAERAKFEVPGQRWADVSQDDYGVSILNDSKYGWDYKDNVLRLTLLKAPIWPDSLADRGRHQFRYAVYPHAGDWKMAGTVRRAAEYNVPFVAAFESEHRGSLGKAVSFASADPSGVEITSLKVAEDSDDWVLRLVEWHGQATRAEVAVGCPVRRARRANLLEDPGEEVAAVGNVLHLSLRAYEIATLLVECER